MFSLKQSLSECTEISLSYSVECRRENICYLVLQLDMLVCVNKKKMQKL